MGQSSATRFGGWTLLRPAGELARGDVRIRLQDQPLAVLEVLLAHPGELVTREQLIARLWPNGIVVDFDTALNSAVRRLRTALDDHADHPRYIETIPRRGYRFIGQLETENAAHVVREQGDVPSPAASPLASEVRPVAGRAHRPAAALAVLAVMLAAGVAAVPALREARQVALPVQPGAVPLAAETRDQYELARFFLNRRDPGDTQRALRLFQYVLRLEPRYARAWAGIASVHWLDTVEARVPRQQGLASTRQAAEQALRLDAGIAEAHLRLANYFRVMGDQARGDELQRVAEVLEPDDPLVLAFRASDAAGRGQYEEAAALQRRATQAGPLSVPARRNLAVWLFLSGRYDEARAELARTNEISGRPTGDDVLPGQSLLLSGEYQAALDQAMKMPEGPARQQILALAYYASGRLEESDAALRALIDGVDGGRAYLVAEVYVYRGDHDAAFEWLQRAVAADPHVCTQRDCWSVDWVPESPLLRPLRGDPRWQHLLSAAAEPALKAARL